jgi:hypothetical protein
MAITPLAARPLQATVGNWALIAAAGFAVGVTGASYENLLKVYIRRRPNVWRQSQLRLPFVKIVHRSN